MSFNWLQTMRNPETAASDIGKGALDEMRALRENLAQINQIGSKDKARMAYLPRQPPGGIGIAHHQPIRADGYSGHR
jgi:hypothetical protein